MTARATPPTKSCAELWKTPFASLLHKYSDECHRGHGGASDCLSITKVHKRIHWPCNQAVRDFQRIMTDYDCQYLVYGDFSPARASTWNPSSKHIGTWSAATRPHFAACVTDQPYSSTIFVSLRLHHCTEKKIGVRFKILFLFSFSFLKPLSLKLLKSGSV